jgi:hypothetical protein
MRKILTLVLLIFSNLAISQDVLEAGQFAVVHVDGHVTNKVFRVVSEKREVARGRSERKRKLGRCYM